MHFAHLKIQDRPGSTESFQVSQIGVEKGLRVQVVETT